MTDKIPAAIVILAAILIVSVIAGWNDNLGKFLFAFVLIFSIVWLVGGGTQGHIHKWGAIGGIYPTPSGKPPVTIA